MITTLRQYNLKNRAGQKISQARIDGPEGVAFGDFRVYACDAPVQRFGTRAAAMTAYEFTRARLMEAQRKTAAVAVEASTPAPRGIATATRNAQQQSLAWARGEAMAIETLRKRNSKRDGEKTEQLRLDGTEDVAEGNFSAYEDGQPPWRIEPSTTGNNYAIIFSGNTRVACVRGPYAERFLAALNGSASNPAARKPGCASKLMSALEGLITAAPLDRDYRCLFCHADTEDGDEHSPLCEIEIGRNALARARGGTS